MVKMSGSHRESRESVSAAQSDMDSVRAYSRLFDNLYLFVTERCQLRCGHCYMGQRLARATDMPTDFAIDTMSYLRRLGSRYLTIVGGEPTLHPDLPELIRKAREFGFDKVMLETNGLRASAVVRSIRPEDLFYVRVSLDGASAATHDFVRGPGNFDRAVAAIRALVEAGFSVRVTTTVFSFSVPEVPDVVRLAGRLGVQLVNLHSFSEEGLGAAQEGWSIGHSEWQGLAGILPQVASEAGVRVRFPPTWVPTASLADCAAHGYRGCVGATLDRLSVFPDGRAYVCSLLFDHPLNFAQMTTDGLVLNREQNEFELFAGAMASAQTRERSGCPAERFLSHNDTAPSRSEVSVCRLWRMEMEPLIQGPIEAQ